MERSSCAASDRSLRRPRRGHGGRCSVRSIADPSIPMGINIEGNMRPLIRGEVATEKNEQLIVACAGVSVKGPAGLNTGAAALQVCRGRKFIPSPRRTTAFEGIIASGYAALRAPHSRRTPNLPFKTPLVGRGDQKFCVMQEKPKE